MASEYLLKKAREQQPAPPPRPLTPAEKRRNWLYYNKIWLILGAALLGVMGSILWNALGVGRVRPDYVFACVTDSALDDALLSALERELASLGADANGDGQVRAEVRQYVLPRGGDPETALYYQYAAQTLLLADLERGESYFFLLQDPQAVQRDYQILANADGGAPAEGDAAIAGKALPWAACPALTALDVDQSALESMYIARRWFAGKAAQGHEAQDALWQTLTKGAIP